MKKALSIVLALLMVVAMIPTVFAASTPVITTTANKTAIAVGDIVTITVSVSKDSNLCALTYDVSYSTDEFEYVDGSVTTYGVFSTEISNASVAGNVRYVAAETTQIGSAKQTLLTFKLKALKSKGTVSVKISEAYVSSGNSETDVTTAVSNASTKSISFTERTSYIDIKTPSTTTIRCKDGIVLHVNAKKTLPSGSTLKWTASNSNFKMTTSNNNKDCTIISENNGSTVFTVTLYSSSGEELDSKTIEMNSQASFFDKIGGFFRSLFGATKIYEN